MLNAKLTDTDWSSGDWFLLDKQDASTAVPSNRGECSSLISVSYEKEVYRLAIESNQGDNAGIQFSEMDWYEQAGSSDSHPHTWVLDLRNLIRGAYSLRETRAFYYWLVVNDNNNNKN